MNYLGRSDFDHGARPAAAVVLVNLGTPDAADTPSVRRYLAEFLADPRVVELPRWQWWPILHGIILRIRPRRSVPDSATLLAANLAGNAVRGDEDPTLDTPESPPP